MEKLHVLCLRNLLWRIHKCQEENGGHMTHIKLAAVTDVCTSLGMRVDVDEVSRTSRSNLSFKLERLVDEHCNRLLCFKLLKARGFTYQAL